jgi:hypothetical protein
MRWYPVLVPTIKKVSQSWDPTPNESIPPQGDATAELPITAPADLPITKKKDKMRPGGKKRKIRWPTVPQPAIPMEASDPRNLRGL